MIRSILFFVLTTILLSACSSGKTAFNRRNFDLAVQKASQRLHQRPGLGKRGHATAAWVLRQAFKRAYEQHQTAIRRLSATTNADAFRWEAVYREYEQLQTLTDNAQRGFDRLVRHTGGFANACDTCNQWLDAYPTSYQDRQQAIRQLAAADRYDAAEQAFVYREENRLAAKEAYLQYRKASEWVPDYRQASAKAADALPFAILRVVVEPLAPTSEISPGDNQELQGLILRQIHRNEAPSTFVRLYPPDEFVGESTRGDGFPIHQAVQMQVTDYTPYNERNTSSSTTVYSNLAYKVGEKKINDTTKVDIMEKVSGTLTTYQRSIKAELILRMRSIDTQSGKEIWEDIVWESRTWQTEWETFSGDDRALNGHTLTTANPFPPSRWQLYDSMRDELASDVIRRLRTKYAHD